MDNEKKNTDVKCVLCGKRLSLLSSKYIVGATGKVVCPQCLTHAMAVSDIFPELEQQEDAKKNEELITPHGIIEHLDKSIIGQDDAKRAVALAIWKQLVIANGEENMPKSNLLLYGPTGCGKTAIIRECAKYVKLPFLSFDSTTITQNGYKGRDAVEVLDDYVRMYSEDPMAEYGVIFFDEFDKLSARGGFEQASHFRATQHCLLKLMEGELNSTESKKFSVKNLLFIFGGAFTGIGKKKNVVKKPIGFEAQLQSTSTESNKVTVEDFIRFGIEPEVTGRIGQLTALAQLSENDLKEIILNSELSVYKKYRKFFEGRGIEFVLSDEQIGEITQEAFGRGTGARGLNVLIDKIAEPLLLKVVNGEMEGSINEGKSISE